MGKFSFDSPFTEYYEADQLVYKKYHNDAFTRFKDLRYYAGLFVPKNLIFDYARCTTFLTLEDSHSLE